MSLAIIAKLPEVLIDLLISTSRPACRLNVPVPVVEIGALIIISVFAWSVTFTFVSRRALSASALIVISLLESSV